MTHKIIAVRKATERGKSNEVPQNLEETTSSNPEQGKPTPTPPAENPVPTSESATASPKVEPPKRDFQRPRKVERPEAKPLIDLSETTNSKGTVFNPGDKIRVRSPWGEEATAEIVKLYQDEVGCPWASYVPSESRPNWSWEKGCIRAALLVKA